MNPNWFEVKVKYDAQTESGEKVISMNVLIDAPNYAEAENRAIEELGPLSQGEFDVADVKRRKYSEVCKSDREEDDKWYEVKCNIITLDEKTNTEKTTSIRLLVQANTLQRSVKRFEELMRGGMTDWELTSVKETSIADIYESVTEPTNP